MSFKISLIDTVKFKTEDLDVFYAYEGFLMLNTILLNEHLLIGPVSSYLLNKLVIIMVRL